MFISLRNMRAAARIVAFFVAAVCVSAYDPTPEPAAVVLGSHARFTVLAPNLVRMQWAASGAAFSDAPTLSVVNRRLPLPPFSVPSSVQLNGDGRPPHPPHGRPRPPEAHHDLSGTAALVRGELKLLGEGMSLLSNTEAHCTGTAPFGKSTAVDSRAIRTTAPPPTASRALLAHTSAPRVVGIADFFQCTAPRASVR